MFDYGGERSWRALRTGDTGLPAIRSPNLAWNQTKTELWVATRNRAWARFDGTTWKTWTAFGKGNQVAAVTLAVKTDKDRVPVDLADQAAFAAAFPTSPRYVRFGDDPTQYRPPSPP